MQFEEIEGRAEMKVLIVVDMQKDFVDGSLGTPEAQAIVPAVVEKAADYEGKVRIIFRRAKGNICRWNIVSRGRRVGNFSRNWKRYAAKDNAPSMKRTHLVRSN